MTVTEGPLPGRHHPDVAHISAGCAPPGVTDDDPLTGCCMGEAMRDPRYCTCWEPVFDVDQAEPDPTSEPATRAKCCHDCAYRRGSPEEQEGARDDLEALASSGRDVFYCHQGMRRAIAYRHPDGRELPAVDGDYQPAQAGGTAYRADGSAADRCAGWGVLAEAMG